MVKALEILDKTWSAQRFPNAVDPEASPILSLTPVSVPQDTLWETLTLCKPLLQLSLWIIQKSKERLTGAGKVPKG